jgi:hypothetical protein
MYHQNRSTGLGLFVSLCLGYACPSPVVAQDKIERVYHIHFTGPITDASEKFLLEGLAAQDPGIERWVDRPTQSAMARTYQELDQAELQAYLLPSGLMIGYMGIMDVGPDGAAHRMAGDDFPVYVDTGDPLHDQTGFLAAKAAWFTAHSGNAPPSDQ